jgi:mRNA interferase MazF
LRRGDLYRVRRPAGDPKASRVFVVASRATLIESRFSTLVCAPVFTCRDGLSTQVDVGATEGLKHDSAIHCDALMSLPKAALTDYVGSLSAGKLASFDQALRVALALD